MEQKVVEDAMDKELPARVLALAMVAVLAWGGVAHAGVCPDPASQPGHHARMHHEPRRAAGGHRHRHVEGAHRAARDAGHAAAWKSPMPGRFYAKPAGVTLQQMKARLQA